MFIHLQDKCTNYDLLKVCHARQPFAAGGQCSASASNPVRTRPQVVTAVTVYPCPVSVRSNGTSVEGRNRTTTRQGTGRTERRACMPLPCSLWHGRIMAASSPYAVICSASFHSAHNFRLLLKRATVITFITYGVPHV
jgi:hypothetical protein